MDCSMTKCWRGLVQRPKLRMVDRRLACAQNDAGHVVVWPLLTHVCVLMMENSGSKHACARSLSCSPKGSH